MSNGQLTIMGQDKTILSGEDAALEMMLGMAEQGYMDPAVFMGQLVAAPGFQSAVARRPTLGPRVMQLASRVAPNLSASLASALRTTQPHLAPAGTPGPMREVVQGLDSGAVAIAAGAQFPVTFNSTMLFRPTRLMIPPTFAPLFVVDDFKVSADSLFLSTGQSVPGENFLPDAVGASALKRRTAAPGTPVQVFVTNVDVVAHRFRGGIFGDANDMGSC